jgi:hypothetical protein
MKKLYVLAGALCLFGSISYAQPFEMTDTMVRKPGLFQQLPDSIPVSSSSLQALLSLNAGSNVIMEISRNGDLPLEGTVTHHSDKYNGRIRSVSIRARDHEGAVLFLSRTVQDNGDIVFRGNWTHREFADVYLLSRHGQDYLLTKKRFRELIME